MNFKVKKSTRDKVDVVKIYVYWRFEQVRDFGTKSGGPLV